MNWKVMRDFALLVAAGLATGVAAKYGNIPTKVAVLESRVDSMDKKLDRILDYVKPQGE